MGHSIKESGESLSWRVSNDPALLKGLLLVVREMVFDFQKACCLKTPRAMPRCALGTVTSRLGGNLRSETGARETGLGSWPQMMVL